MNLLLTYTLDSVKFECTKCGKENCVIRRSGSTATGVFCPECDQHNWINWTEGSLHAGVETVDLCTGFTEGVVYD